LGGRERKEREGREGWGKGIVPPRQTFSPGV